MAAETWACPNCGWYNERDRTQCLACLADPDAGTCTSPLLCRLSVHVSIVSMKIYIVICDILTLKCSLCGLWETWTLGQTVQRVPTIFPRTQHLLNLSPCSQCPSFILSFYRKREYVEDIQNPIYFQILLFSAINPRKSEKY